MRIARAESLLAVLLLAATGAGAAGLGTLFNTPEERARLDRLRRGEAAPAELQAAVPGARAITGYVKRSDGRATVWIDGVPVTLADPKAATALDPRTVRGYADREDNTLKIERRPPR